MRKPFIAGNWKMHGSLNQIQELVNGLKQSPQQSSAIDRVICPTSIHLLYVHELIKQTSIQLGAQNLYLGSQGAFTGEISGPMLKEVGCDYVLVGHSERRTLFHEDLELIAKKFKAALDANLIPILCVGETQAEREGKKTDAIVQKQLNSVIDFVGIDQFKNVLIAYEPVWAIGTGLSATPLQAQTVHAMIREIIKQNNVDLANTIRILYGGSMKAENAATLLAMPDIDGGLIGGASLDASSFLTICDAAMEQSKAETIMR